MTQNLSTLDWHKNPDGLLPAVVQDANTARVLMLGYMNEEALRRTQETRLVTFYSRSKQRLWKKGESSGNTLQFVSAWADCDSDAVLVRAVPAGPTCHTGETTCFTAEELGPETLGELGETIRRRSESGSEASYTKRLLQGGVDAYGAKCSKRPRKSCGPPGPRAEPARSKRRPTCCIIFSFSCAGNTSRSATLPWNCSGVADNSAAGVHSEPEVP